MTITVNVAGFTRLKLLPCGFDEHGLPIGLQLIGNVPREDQLFQVAYAYEQATTWKTQLPQPN